MQEAKGWSSVHRGLLLAALYCAAFKLLWFGSLDQWYLPAGLRVAALVLLAPRWWPYLFLGDAIAVFSLRWPKIELHGEAWAIVPSLVLLPLISIVPALYRRWLSPLTEHVRWLPLVMISTALWGEFWMLALNQALSASPSPATLAQFLKWSTGDYLGMLMLVPMALVWVRRREDSYRPRHLLRDSAIAVAFVAAMYLAIAQTVHVDASLKQLLLLMMLAPAVVLMLLHGWRGAAVGIVLVNLAMQKTIPSFHFAGAGDATTFFAQQVMAAIATGLFVVGAIVSAHFDRARRLGLAEAHALRIAQASMLSSERHMRDRVLLLAQMQARIEDSKRTLIQRLRAQGRPAAAMEVLRDATLHSEIFEAHAAVLYPIAIESGGLYAALQTPSFAGVWAEQRPVRLFLRGHASQLSVDLQIAAYRCACSAIAVLSAGHPTRYRLSARAWRVGARQGIALTITAVGASDWQRTQASTLAELELEGRLKLHGGTSRRRRVERIGLLLAESIEGEAHSIGDTDHTSPLAV